MLNGLFDEIRSRPLGLARAIVGAAAFIRVWVALPELIALTDPVVLNIPYASWIPEPTPALVATICIVWAASALLFMVGWRVPLSGTVLLLTVAGTLALDEQLYGNHLYLMGWLVLLMTIAGAGSGLNLHRTDRPVVRWPVLLLMAQLSIVYGFSAITKLNEGFLSGTVLASYVGTGFVPFPEALRTPGFLAPLAGVVLFVELFIAVFIWRPRFRPAAFLLGFCLHISIVFLMADTAKLVVFALEMLALYPLFLPEEKLRVSFSQTSERDRTLVTRLTRFDVLQMLEPNEVESGELTVELKGGVVVTGFNAAQRMLDRLVPTLWFSAALRLPGVRSLGRHRFDRNRQSHGASARV